MTADRPGGLELTRRLLASAGLPQGARLLDVCCGDGTTVYYLSGLGYRAEGIDIDPAAAGKPSLRQGSAYALPYGRSVMDGVLCECALCLLEEPESALHEWARVLKPEGRLLLSDLYSRGSGYAGTRRLHTREELGILLTGCGFAVGRFEDHTETLKAMAAQAIFDGNYEALRAELGPDVEALRSAGCGYYLLTAELAAGRGSRSP